MREKLLELKIDTTQVLRDTADAVYLTDHDADQILTLLKEEIKKSRLTDEETRRACRITAKSIATPGNYSITAQAQLDKVLKVLT